MLFKFSRFFHTVRFLTTQQILAQVTFRVRKKFMRKKRFLRKSDFSLRPHDGKEAWQQFITKQDQFDGECHIKALNICQDISSAHIWQDKSQSYLWLYHLHYFNYVPSQKLILRWINENQPGRGVGFEPYPLALRIVNWIKWLLAKRDDATYADLSPIQQSLMLQVHYLLQQLEFHILGNHLLANAKAILFAGFYFTHNGWLNRGLQLFKSQLNAQILADGGHFELSPMYHAIILEDLLDVIQLCQMYEYPYPKDWDKTVTKMLHWLQTMCHPDGDFALFNDTAHNMAANFTELYDYAKQLLPTLSANNLLKLNLKSLVYLPHSGYCRIAEGRMVLIADVAPIGASYQPGHAHADTLAFELSIEKQRVFVNTGTSTYAEGSKRLHERSTPAHNTLVLNQQNSTEVWKSFRVARRACVRDVIVQHQTLTASHDGYIHQYQLMHTRTWQFINKALHIIDKIDGPEGRHQITLYFHLHPAIQAVNDNARKRIKLHHNGKSIACITTEKPAIIKTTTYHPGFNISLPNQKIILEMIATIPIQLTTIIRCTEA